MKIIESGIIFFGMAGVLAAAHAEVVTRSVPLTREITRVYLHGSNELHLTQGEEEYVKVTAPEEMIARSKARVKGRSLYLGNERDWDDISWGFSDSDTPVRFDVQLARIDAIRVRGSGQAYVGDIVAGDLKIIMYGMGKAVVQSIKAHDVSVEISGACHFQGDRIDSEEMGIEINGSAKINIAHIVTGEVEIDIAGSGEVKLENLNAGELETEINGSGDLDLAGRIGNQDLEINGSGDYRASKLVSEDAYIEIRGSGNVEISVEKRLTAEISRGADLVYYGGPELEADISGRGRSRNAGNISTN